jgi:hypothetical protein
MIAAMSLGECPRNLLTVSFCVDNQQQGSDRTWEPRIYHNLPRCSATQRQVTDPTRQLSNPAQAPGSVSPSGSLTSSPAAKSEMLSSMEFKEKNSVLPDEPNSSADNEQSPRLQSSNFGLETPLSEFIIASAAAPMYFPSHRGHVDGGVVSNNPAIAAVTAVLSPDVVGTPKVPSQVRCSNSSKIFRRTKD